MGTFLKKKTAFVFFFIPVDKAEFKRAFSFAGTWCLSTLSLEKSSSGSQEVHSNRSGLFGVKKTKRDKSGSIAVMAEETKKDQILKSFSRRKRLHRAVHKVN